MASKQSTTINRQSTNIISIILVIGHIELYIFRFIFLLLENIFSFIRRWIVSILCIMSGVTIAYLFLYFFIVLPQPTILSQYQHVPSIVIVDNKGTLLYKEWNTQRQMVSAQDVAYFLDVLPSKEKMASYLALNTTRLNTAKDKYWFQKKMMYLYPHTSIATTYMNAKIFQNGVVGIRDATEVYYQKNVKIVEKAIVKILLNPEKVIPQKNLYARMPIEVAAIRSYLQKKKITNKKTGWLRVETSLDVYIGITVAYNSLIDPNNNAVIIEGDKVRAWTKKNDQLLAARSIVRTKEGGEYK